MNQIKIALVGIGNCASSLIQGLEYYKWVDDQSGFVPGIIHNTIGVYKISDIKIVAAFDVDNNKVGKDISEAIFSSPNCAINFCKVPRKNVEVKRGPLLDGIGPLLKQKISVNPKKPEIDIVQDLKNSGAELLINLLPTGSVKATEYYANEAIKARCGFINCIPECVASNEKFGKKFKRAGLPLVGDDIKSQLGATNLHRALIDLFLACGCKITNTRQVNFGYNTDFINLNDEYRGKSKIKSKISALTTNIPYEVPVNMKIQLKNSKIDSLFEDRKKTVISINGDSFGMRPISIHVDLSVEDSPNAGGVLIDVIRAMKLALVRNDSGIINPISQNFFKQPPFPSNDHKSRQDFELYVKGEGGI